jgi:peptide subunit release factor 1 (eRF1)
VQVILRTTIQSKNIVFSECNLFIPPNPIKKFYYKCDKCFHLDDLIELYRTYDTYAIVLISGKRSDIYIHSNNNTQMIKSIKFELPNQHKTGGSSAPRMGRIRDEKINLYIKKLTEIMVSLYIKEGVFQHLGLIIAGPALLKDKIQSEKLFALYFQKHLLKTITTAEIEDNSICQVILSITDIINDETNSSELIETMLNNPEMIDLFVFGEDNVLEAHLQGILVEIFVHETVLNLVVPNDKTKINIVKDNKFVRKYGHFVGIKYFAIDNFDN